MKILLDISPLVLENLTGIGNYVYYLTKNVLETDTTNDYFLFCFSPLDKVRKMKNHEFGKYKSVKGNTVFPLPSRMSLKYFLIWQSISYPSIETLAGVNIDVVHNHEWFTPSVRKSTSLVSTVFDLTTIKHPEWHKNKNVQLQNKRLSRLNISKKIITISSASKNDLKEYNLSFFNKTEIIYPGIGSDIKVVNREEKEQVRDKYNLKRPFILSVGTIEPRKNITTLIKAFTPLIPHIDIDLVIIGNVGWGNIVNNTENPERVHYLGYVSNTDLNLLYNACLFFAYPSLYEGFGLPVLEALSVGKHVLTSNRSSLPEVAGSAGTIINPYSVADITNALVDLVKNSNEDIVYKDSLTHASNFSYLSSAKKLINLYNNLK